MSSTKTTEMSTAAFAQLVTSKEKAQERWFSRRHETAVPHTTAIDIREEREVEKANGAKCRTSRRAKRTPAEQLALLDERLGAGVGAAKERARLEAQLAA